MNEWRRLLLMRVAFGAAFAVSLAVSAMLVMHRSSHPVVGSLSPAAAAALLLAVSTALAALVLLVSPRTTLCRLDRWILEGLAPFQNELPRGRPRIGVALAIIALTTYLLIAVTLIAANLDPRNDQLDYLQTAARIRQMGLLELVRQLFVGTYLEANRHPLYTALLAQVTDFQSAKRLGGILGAGLVIVGWWGATRRMGWMVGGVTAVLLATNSLLQQSATLIACETLLALCCLLAWLAIERFLAPQPRTGGQSSGESLPAERGAERVESAPDSGSTDRAALGAFANGGVLSIVIGLLLGLAYLVKASAVFLLGGFLFWSVSVAGLRRWSWLALVAFVAISAPLLVRNTRAYSDPLYSFNNRFLFADSFEQGLALEYRGTWAALRDYWNTHTGRAIAARWFSGLGWEGLILLRSLGPAGMGDSRSLVGLIISLVAGLGALCSDRRLVLAALSWIVPLFFFFAWYVPIAAGDRFLAPVVPIVLLFASRGTVQLIAASSNGAAAQIERRLLVLTALWCLTAVMLALHLHSTTTSSG